MPNPRGILRALKNRFRRHHRTYASDDENDAQDTFIWDIEDPFAQPDPDLAHLRALLQAECVHMRRFEDIGPLDPLPDEDENDDTDSDSGFDSETDSEHENEDEEDEADDEAEDSDEYEEEEPEDKLAPISLPRLLPIPIRFIPTPPAPPPTRCPSFEQGTWADLAKVYNDIANADERARKARRDACRSRAKALAILGPEASIAF